MSTVISGASKRITVPALSERKVRRGKAPIVALTAYDFTFAKLLDEAGVDLLLVGDSLGCVLHGAENTLQVTIDDIVYHARCVARGAKRSVLVGDMPFLSFQKSDEQALENAGRLLSEGGMHAVKLEGGENIADMIALLSKYDIPVLAHIGLTPQSYHRMGGHKRQGLGRSGSTPPEQLLIDAKAVEESGAFACVLEGIPAALAAEITEALSIPTIGIGAGDACDGQILVSYDMLGMNKDFRPSFLTVYAELGEAIQQATQDYAKDVESRALATGVLRLAK